MNKHAGHSRTTTRSGVVGLRVLGRQIRHRRIVLEIVVAVRDQWLATTHLGYTSLMRTLVATLTALMLFATTPVVAGDFGMELSGIMRATIRKLSDCGSRLLNRGISLRNPYLVWNGLNEPRTRILGLI